MSTPRLPQASEGRPAAIEPTTVPINAEATVNPSQKSLSSKTFLSWSVVPWMTIVSKPKSRPPRAAMSTLPRR